MMDDKQPEPSKSKTLIPEVLGLQSRKSGKAGAQRKTVLFAVSEYGEFFSLLDIAKLLEIELNLHPVFLFKADYGALNTHSRLLEALNFSWTTAHSIHEKFDASGLEPGVNDYVPSALRSSGLSTVGVDNTNSKRTGVDPILFQMYSFFLYLKDRLKRRRGRGDNENSQKNAAPGLVVEQFYRRMLDRVSAVIQDFNPQIIISGQDYPLSITSMAALAGSKQGIKTVIIPFSMTPTTKEIAESFFGSRTNELKSRFEQIWIAKYLAPWLHQYRGRFYIRLSPMEALASNRLGLTPLQPWTPNSGRGIVFAPSQQGYDYALSAGIPKDQLQLTGALWSDKLIALGATREQRRNELIRDILVFETYARNVARSKTIQRSSKPVKVDAEDQQKTLLIFSWPPNQSPRRPNGFLTFDEMNKALAEMLIALAMSAPVKIAISLHPTLLNTPLGAELKAAGLYIIDKPLIDVIDCSNVFCATVSSTLMWSLQAGIPSVNFDIYSYGYSEFVKAGMREAKTISNLRNELLLMIEDTAKRESVISDIIEKRDYWTSLDGGAAEKIVGSIRKLLSPVTN